MLEKKLKWLKKEIKKDSMNWFHLFHRAGSMADLVVEYQGNNIQVLLCATASSINLGGFFYIDTLERVVYRVSIQSIICFFIHICLAIQGCLCEHTTWTVWVCWECFYVDCIIMAWASTSLFPLCSWTPTMLCLTRSNSTGSSVFLSVVDRTGLSVDTETMAWMSVWDHACQWFVTSGKRGEIADIFTLPPPILSWLPVRSARCSSKTLKSGCWSAQNGD